MDDDRRDGDGREEYLETAVVSGCNPPPVCQPAERGLDPFAPFVSALVVKCRFLPRFATRYAGL